MVDLDLGTVTGDPVLTGIDTLRSIEAIRGSYLADTYDATGFSNLSLNAGSSGTLNEFEGMAGNDTITGNGSTRLSYVSAREGVSVDLQASTAVGGTSVGTDTIVGGVNAMRGSNFDDVLMGTNHGINSAQVYEGRAGNDTFSGRGGFDQAVYSSESTQMGITVDMDAINAFTGTVIGDAGIGTDTLIDIVSVVGTFFNDFYNATGYNSAVSTLGTFNEFEGGFGDDTIIGNGNTRVAYLGAGSGVTVDLGAGTAFGASSGSDTLSGVNAVRGSNFDDLFRSARRRTRPSKAAAAIDTIDGGDGIDLVRYDFGATGAGTFTRDRTGPVHGERCPDSAPTRSPASSRSAAPTSATYSTARLRRLATPSTGAAATTRSSARTQTTPCSAATATTCCAAAWARTPSTAAWARTASTSTSSRRPGTPSPASRRCPAATCSTSPTCSASRPATLAAPAAYWPTLSGSRPRTRMPSCRSTPTAAPAAGTGRRSPPCSEARGSNLNTLVNGGNLDILI